MKFTANTHDIADGLAIVTRALPSKPATQALDGIHVQCDGNTLSLTCSDGTMSISWTGNVTVQEQGETIIQGKLFSDLMRKLPNTTVTITADDKTATVAYNRSRSRIAVLPGPYPERNDVKNAASFTIPASTLRDLVSHVLPAIATDTTRIILTGALLDITPSDITAVSLDGFRLAMMRHAADMGLTGKDHISAVIPRKTITELSRILPADSDPVTVLVSTSAISINLGTTQITSTLLAGEYIDYTKIIPTDYKTMALVKTSDLQDALDRASLMAREGKNNLVRLDLADHTLSVSSRSATGSIEEQVDCDQQGDNITIAFNSAYIADALRNIPDDTVSIGFNSPASPAVFFPQHSRDWLYLVLPVRTV